MSLGTDRDPRFFILETRYNNQTNISGIVDSSGIRITYTPEVRKYDAGMLITGFFVDPSEIIPPYEESFISKGYCSEQDLAKGAPEEGVNVFAVLQHSHLLAKKFRTCVCLGMDPGLNHSLTITTMISTSKNFTTSNVNASSKRQVLYI
ncbi:DBH-like monooxygenase protein 1 [Argopecten irradians]|uniref:DBH-like monooxygenase protein 1 n=1 Tax=Argopecten irradians TaxID=31199 RepID=UPI00370FEBEB